MHPYQQGNAGTSRSHLSNSAPYFNNPSTLGARAAYAVTSALADPYGQARASYYSYINQNYAQAYYNQMLLQQQQQRPRTTEEGYTLSSTYDPSREPVSSSSTTPYASRNNRASSSSQRPPSHAPIRTQSNKQQQHYPQAHHRRPPAPGDIKCTYPGCSYSGSEHAVEIHRMDRHLIFPPGWKKKTNDWDADPSLKGKPIPILGTGLVLDTPESIDAWIAERRKRWPSKQNVEEKKKREQEAAQRGEINPKDLSRSTTKGINKRRLGNNEERTQRKNQHSSSTFFQSHKRAKTAATGSNNIAVDGNQPQSLESSSVGGTSPAKKEVVPSSTITASGSDNPTDPATDNCVNSLSSNAALDTISSSHNLDKPDEDDDDADSDDGSDVDPVRDAISSKQPVDMPEEYPSVAIVEEQNENGQSTLQKHQIESTAFKNKKPRPLPKRPTRNPFASKSHLLRNLLLPEIRNTVSNLSQAIHFLAENDFLVGVELKPGDADAQLIRVLDNKETSS